MFLINFITLINAETRFIYMRNDIQPIKTITQTKDFTELVYPAFRKIDVKPFVVFSDPHDIAMLRTEDELVSALYTTKTKFYSDSEQRTVYLFYSVFTNENFRNKGHAKKLLIKTVDYINKKEKNVLFALHLNPADSMMNFNYAFYYSLGFTKGSVCEFGSEDYKMKYEEIKDLKDVREIDIENCREKGYYICMFCESNDFNKSSKIDLKMIDEGELVRNKLNIKKVKEEKEKEENKGKENM
ncbi:hypothetical protein GVAV_002826 [Gurleya vavrai]